MRGKLSIFLLILVIVAINATSFAQRTQVTVRNKNTARSGSTVSQTVNANFVPTSNLVSTNQTAPGNPYSRVMSGLKDMKLREMGPGSQSAVCSRYFENCDKLYDRKTKTFSDARCQGYIDECIKFIGITPQSCIERFDTCIAQACSPAEACADFNEAQTIAGSCLSGLQNYHKYACTNRQFAASVKKFSTVASQNLATEAAERETQLAQSQVSQLQAQLERQKQEAAAAVEQARQEAVSSSSSSGTDYAEANQMDFLASEEFDKCMEKLNKAQNMLQILQNYVQCAPDGEDPRDKLVVNNQDFSGLDLLGGISSMEYYDECKALPLRLTATKTKVSDYTKAMDEYKSCVTSTIKTSQKAQALDKIELQKLNKLLTFLRTGSVNTIANRLLPSNFVKYDATTKTYGDKEYRLSKDTGGRKAAVYQLSETMTKSQTLYNIADFINEEFAKVVGGESINIQVAQGYQIAAEDCMQYVRTNNITGYNICRQQQSQRILLEIEQNINNKVVLQRNIPVLRTLGCPTLTDKSTIDDIRACVNSMNGISSFQQSCTTVSNGNTVTVPHGGGDGNGRVCNNGQWIGGSPSSSQPTPKPTTESAGSPI